MTELLPHALRAFDDCTSHVSPERRLMLATIINAISDATGFANSRHPGERAKARRDALNWFKFGDGDFEVVCDLAGLDPTATRRAVLRYIAQGNRMPASRRSNRSTRQSGLAVASHSAPTRAAIARQAGVSPSSVQNVLNGTGRPSATMRQRVRRAARELVSARDAA